MPTNGLSAVSINVFMVVFPELTPDLAVALPDGREVDVGVVDAVEDVGEGRRRESETDLHQLRVAVPSGPDRREILVADGAARGREPADEADQRIALGIAGRLAVADVPELVGLQPRELAEQ